MTLPNPITQNDYKQISRISEQQKSIPEDVKLGMKTIPTIHHIRIYVSDACYQEMGEYCVNSYCQCNCHLGENVK